MTRVDSASFLMNSFVSKYFSQSPRLRAEQSVGHSIFFSVSKGFFLFDKTLIGLVIHEVSTIDSLRPIISSVGILADQATRPDLE
jgi:hypothetical protein